MILEKQREMKTFEWIIFSNPFKARGLHPSGAPLVHPNESSTPGDRMLISKAYDETKTRLTSKSTSGR
jgi:hypothetical protein